MTYRTRGPSMATTDFTTKPLMHEIACCGCLLRLLKSFFKNTIYIPQKILAVEPFCTAHDGQLAPKL